MIVMACSVWPHKGQEACEGHDGEGRDEEGAIMLMVVIVTYERDG